MNLDKILNEWEEESVIGHDLEETTKDIPRLHSKYLRLRSAAKMKHRSLKNEQKTLLLNKWKWYEGVLTKGEIESLGWKHDPFDGKSVMKSQYDRYIDADSDVQSSIEKIQYYEEVIATLEDILRALNWRHTHIKNIVETRKFESGY